MALSAKLNESRRYARISALVLAGLGPPRSQRAGGFSPMICLAQASLAHATCFTCSANERTPLNSPWVGLNDHLSSGMASARPVKSFSMLFQIKLIESGMFFGKAGRCCVVPAAGFMSSAAAMSKAKGLFMGVLRLFGQELIWGISKR